MRRALTTACAAFAAAAAAQSPLTLGFAADNASAVGGAVYFDLVVAAEVTLTRLDLDCAGAAGQPGTLTLRTTPTSHIGQETNAAAWTTAGTASVTTQGLDRATPALFGNGIRLPPGSYGIQLVATGFGHAWSFGTPANRSRSNRELTFTGGSGQDAPFTGAVVLDRIWNGAIAYTTPPGYATTGLFGTGCYDEQVAFYEAFAPGAFDLAGPPGPPVGTRSLLCTHQADGSLRVAPGNGTWTAPSGPVLALGDDAVLAQSLPFAFPFAGRATPTIGICSNGYVWLDPATAADWAPTAAELLAGPARIAVGWCDLDPTAGGAIRFHTDAGGAYVTWSGVPGYGSATTVTMQLALRANGDFELRWQGAGNPFGPMLVGASEGHGARDPGGRDLSTLTGGGFATARSIASPRLDATARPVVGTSLLAATTRLPAGTAVGVQSLGLTPFPAGIPLDLLGLPGCRSWCSADSWSVLATQGSPPVLVYAQTIPLQVALSGVAIQLQSYAFAPGYNAAGLLASNGLSAVLGIR